jgi:hypothetical protein
VIDGGGGVERSKASASTAPSAGISRKNLPIMPSLLANSMRPAQAWNGACFSGMTFDPGVRTIDPPLNVPWERSTFNGVVYPDLFIDGDITVTGEPAAVPTLGASQFSRVFVYPVSLGVHYDLS